MKKTAIAAVAVIVALTGGVVIHKILSRRSYPSQQEMQTIANQMAARTLHPSGDADGFPYRLYIPDGHKKSRQLPLVISLHQGGANGYDNINQVNASVKELISDRFQKRHPAFVVAPQCPPDVQWTDLKANDLPFKNYSVDESRESGRIKGIVRLIGELEAEFKINRNRIYVAGFSMRSNNTWDLIFRHPDLFAGAITMSGISDPASAFRVAHLPIWVFHGRFDRISPIQNSIDMVDALNKQNGKVKFTTLLWGHGVMNAAVNEYACFEWLFDQHR